jgi:hypothetical protein
MLPEESKNAIPAVEHSEDEAQPTTTKRRRTDNPGGRGGSSDGNSDEDLIATLDPPSKGKGKAISKNKARGVQPEPKRKVSEEDMVEVSLGTLTITQNGEAHFVGASGGSSLLHVCYPFELCHADSQDLTPECKGGWCIRSRARFGFDWTIIHPTEHTGNNLTSKHNYC